VVEWCGVTVLAKIGEEKLFKALLDPLLEPQLETQEKSNFVKEEDCGKKRRKIKTQVKGAPVPSPFSDLKSKIQSYFM
jgi:hypothetical protein